MARRQPVLVLGDRVLKFVDMVFVEPQIAAPEKLNVRVLTTA